MERQTSLYTRNFASMNEHIYVLRYVFISYYALVHVSHICINTEAHNAITITALEIGVLQCMVE